MNKRICFFAPDMAELFFPEFRKVKFGGSEVQPHMLAKELARICGFFCFCGYNASTIFLGLFIRYRYYGKLFS